MFWYLPENLEKEQLAKLVELRAELEGAAAVLPSDTGLSDDMTLVRFLKARQWNVHRAAKMYQVRGQGKGLQVFVGVG